MEALREKYVENTRAALLDAARSLFGTRDYADVAAEELVRTAGLTRGALYHHFNGKQGLFEAIFSELEEETAQRVVAAMDSVEDLFARADAGAAAYLERCAEPEFRHIVLQQGPIALGWQRCIEIDTQHLGGILLDTVQAMVDAALIKPHPPELITSALYGALTDLALTIAVADDPGAAQAQAGALAHDLLEGLRIR